MKNQSSLLYLLLSTLLLSCSSPTTQQATSESPRSGPRVETTLEFDTMILSIFEDSKGNFWFGSWCDGLCKYDPTTTIKNGKKQFTYYTVEDGIPGAEIMEFNNRAVPKGNSVRTIQEDKHGNIIFSVLHGFVKFDGEKFTSIEPETNRKVITELFDSGQDNNQPNNTAEWDTLFQQLWFGNADRNGAFLYNGEHLQPVTFPTPNEFYNGTRSQYATYSLYKDRDKNTWFGTENGGIMRFNASGFFCINEEEEKGIVRSIFQDKSGKIWIGNVLMGLYCYDHSAFLAKKPYLKNFTKEMGYYSLGEIRADGSLDESKLLDSVQAIEQDEDGNLWFGSFGRGLWKYDGTKISHFNKENGLPANTVKSIYKGKDGKLWFAIGRTPCHVYHYDGAAFRRVDE